MEDGRPSKRKPLSPGQAYLSAAQGRDLGFGARSLFRLYLL